jgi:PKD repeat protein
MNWNFGDGGTSAVSSPSYTFTNAGTYTVTLYGDYNGTTYSVARTNLVVVNPAPVARFDANVTGGKTNLYVAFINKSLNATSFVWNYGDTNVVTLNTSTNLYGSHTYTNVGTYTVSLQAIAYGATNTLTRTNYITVTP